MTLTELIQIIWRKYDKSVDYPSSGEEDYDLILGFINDAIQAWGGAAHEDNIRWKELFTNLSDAADGDDTTVASTAAYECPTDFVDMSSFVKVTDSTGNSVYYAYAKPEEVETILRVDSSKKFYWLTYADGLYSINLSPTPTTSGDTIEYSYFKAPTELADGADVIEMKKPYFAVYHTLAALLEDERPDLAGVYSQKASELMKAMLLDNEVPPFNQSSKLQDIAYTMTGDAFGI